MEDVTTLAHTYRDCARHVWNTYFRTMEGGHSSFRNVDNVLFQTLILDQLGTPHAYRLSTGDPIVFLRVTLPYTTPTKLLWAKLDPATELDYWRYEDTIITPDTIELCFINYYDWDQLGYRDWQYCRARVMHVTENSRLVGGEILIPALDASIYFLEDVAAMLEASPDWSR